MDPVLQEPNKSIDNALIHLKRELSTIRAGRANPTLIENIPVPAYGSSMKLVELGTISAPQPSLLTVQVWDASLSNDIQKAIIAANLGLNPASDGQLIRIPIPTLTEERREEFVKLAHQKGEMGKVEIRRVRAEERETWDKEKEAGNYGEDEFDRREKLLQALIDKSIAMVDKMVDEKEQELRQV